MREAREPFPSPDDDRAIASFSEAHPGMQVEIDGHGAFRLSPNHTASGPREVEAIYQLRRFAGVAGGKVYGSSTGFRLRDRSVLSPDTAWLSDERAAALDPAQKTGYWRTCPDVVIEILSESDRWKTLLAKMEVYRQNGTPYVVAIDPYRRNIETRGEPPVGLALDVDAIMDA